MVLHEQDLLVADHARQALALLQRIRGAGVVIVVGDVAVEKRRRLARRQQAVVLQHIERDRPRLVRVQHDASAADAMDRRVDALRRQFDHAFALERRARLVEHDHVARARLRPMQAEGQDQVAVVAARAR